MLHQLLNDSQNRLSAESLAAELLQNPSIAFEKCISCNNMFNWLPLHVAIYKKCGIDIIKLLVGANRDALKATLIQHEGGLAVHLACSVLSDDEVIRYIAEAYPEGVKHQESNGCLPIHIAFFGTKLSINAVQCLADLYPESLLVKNYFGDLPIHVALKYNHFEDIVIYLARRCPDSLLVKNENGYIALHIAITQKKAALVQAFIEILPSSLSIKSFGGHLAIHLCCMETIVNLDGMDLPMLMANIYPEGLRVKDDCNWLPIHYLCTSCAYLHLIPTFVAIYPECLSEEAPEDGLPINILCRMHLNLVSEHIKSMALKCPDSLLNMGRYGFIPLQRLLRNKDVAEHLDIVRLFVQLRPSSVHVKSSKQKDVLSIARMYVEENRAAYRIVLNSDPKGIKDFLHKQSYFDMNWSAREKLFHLAIALLCKHVNKSPA